MNEYLRQVEKELRLPRRKKQEVLRDLREIFESAREHGESEADMVERLGSAAEYAAAVSVPLCGKRRPLLCCRLLFWRWLPFLRQPGGSFPCVQGGNGPEQAP